MYHKVSGAAAMVNTFMAMVIKYEEQTNNCGVARNYSVSRGKCPKVETTKTETYANST
jgi:hypothetical protein